MRAEQARVLILKEKESVNLPFANLTGRNLLLFRIVVFGILPLAMLITGTYRIAFTPCDAETLGRFIKPFMFMDVSNFSWAAYESYSYGIVRPLYGISFFNDFSLWGTSFFHYHVTDLILSWIVFLMTYLLFRKRFSRFVSVLAVTIWAVLPLQSYSLVTFVGRNDRIMTIFILGALLAYDRAIKVTEGRRKWLLVSLLVFSAGVFSKESIFYYSIYLFSWSVIVAGRKIIDTLKQDIILWGGMAAVTVLYFSIRLLLGIPMGNPTVYNTGVDYLSLLGQMFFWSFPLTVPSPLLPAAGGLCIMAVGVAAFTRRIPANIRYGSFCLFVGFLHIPVFWIQKCFLWLPWLWGGLAAAGALSLFVQWAEKRFGRAGSSAVYVFVVMILGFSVFWSRRTIDEVVHPAMVFDAAVTFIIENSEEGDYSLDILYARPEMFGIILPDEDTRVYVQQKYHEYIENLMQLRLNDSGLELEPFSR